MNYDFYVFYHYPCNDGELARVIWEHFEPNSCFYKWKHQNDHEDDIKIINNLPEKSYIVFLDLTPSMNVINRLNNNHNYIIIDHHKNPIQTLVENKKSLPNYNILLYVQKGFPEKNNQSGCVLTWQYFTEIKLPKVVYYIGSKDVWDFSDPNTEKYCLGFNHHIINYNEIAKLCFINDLIDDDNYYHNIFIDIGNNLIEEYKKEAEDIFINYKLNTTKGYFKDLNIIDIKCSNTNLYKYLIDFAKDNFDEQDVLRILHSETENKLSYSLRSLKDNINVDSMARFYGGNGHEKAAGYTINIF